MALATPAMANVDRRKQLLAKLAAQAQSHVANSAAMNEQERRQQLLQQIGSIRAAGGGGAANGTARQSSRTQMIHGSSVLAALRSRLGVGGRFADAAEHSNFVAAPQMPAPPPPAAGSDAAPVANPTPGAPQPAAATPAPSALPPGIVDAGQGSYAPTAQDQAIKGQTTTFWANEANMNPDTGMPQGAVQIGNGVWFDPASGQIFNSGAQSTGAASLGHGRVTD